jgi:hypothetical protein
MGTAGFCDGSAARRDRARLAAAERTIMRAFPAFVFLLAASACAQAAEPLGAIDRLTIKDECSTLLLTYGEGLDEVNPQKIWPVFTTDGVWSADANPPVEGQAAIRTLWEGLAARKRPTVGVHAISNIRFDVVDAASANGTALVTMHRYNPDKPDEITSLAANMLIKIDMHCVATPDGWRFDRMHLKSVQVAGYVHGEN